MNDSPKLDVLRDSRISAEISLKGAPDTPASPLLNGDLPSSHGRIEFNGFVLDLQRGCLLARNQEVALRPKAYEVLSYLARNHGRLVSKDELIKAVWPKVVVTDDSLFQCITELRRALEDDGQRLIKTIQRRGYRFEAKLIGQPDVPALPDADASCLKREHGDSPAVDLHRVATPKRIISFVAIAAVLITLAALAINNWWSGTAAQSASGPISLVVLPLRTLNDDPQLEAFATGVTVELTSDLSRLPGAIVISPATALKEQSADVRQIGRDLNVRYVVQGTIARAEKEFRINIQLIETATGRHVWADRQVHEAGQTPAWQDEVVGGIASTLNFKLTRLESERVQRERPRNPEAYDLTTRGWALVYSAKRPETYQNALAMFREALGQDAGSVNALAGIGWISALSVLNDWSKSPREDMAAAKRMAEQLLAIDPTHVVAHHIRGASLRFEKNTEAARDAFKTAISFNPNFANSHAQLGQTNIELGHPEDGIPSLEKAMRLSPRDPNVGHWMANIGIAQLHLRRYPEAVMWLKRSHETGTSSPTLRHRAYLVSALALAGRMDEARAALKELQSVRPDATLTTMQSVSRSMNPQFMKQLQPLYDGLRLAGLPE